MSEIIIQTPQNDSLVSQLVSVYRTFKDVHFDTPRNFDVSNVGWFSPLLLLPLSAHIHCYGSKIIGGTDHNNYLKTIHFPDGVDSLSEFDRGVQSQKSYVPISVLKRNKGSEREKLETQFLMMVYKILGSVPGAQNAVHYPITELVTNIFEHSKQDKGFIFGQYYPAKNYLDICILDCGRGLAKGYQEERGIFLNDEDAITEAMNGNSTKPSTERGYGVRTSKRVVCECLGGEFIFLSGSSALVATKETEKIVTLPNFSWRGVIIAYRIPKPTREIDIARYLE